MEGDCVEISDMKCNRTCDGTRFPVNRVDYILLEVGHGINWERTCEPQESLYSGREGGFGEMPKGFDWRHTPPPNLGSWQTQVVTLHQLFRQGVVLWCLENWCKMQDTHPGHPFSNRKLIQDDHLEDPSIFFDIRSQVEQTGGSLLWYPGEQRDEVHWGDYCLVTTTTATSSTY